MKNMANMLKQAQQMQKNMKTLQEKLESEEVEGQASNGLVKVTMTCKHNVKSIKVDPSVVDADDIETLEDLLTVALNDAVSKIESYVNSEVSKVTGGMNMPGLM